MCLEVSKFNMFNVDLKKAPRSKKNQGHNVEELKFTKDATKYCLGMNY